MKALSVLLAIALVLAITASSLLVSATPSEKNVRATILYKEDTKPPFGIKSLQKPASERVAEKIVKSNGHIRRTLSTINAVTADLPESVIAELEKDPNVLGVERSIPVHTLLQESVPLVNADEVWNTLIEGTNITGKGTSVCIIDTGVDYTHNDLGNCTIKNRTLVGQTESYSLESLHPYPDNTETTWQITMPGYSNISVHFSSINVEPHYDYVYILDADNNTIKNYTGEHSDVWSPTVSGDTIYVKLSADPYINAYGFQLDEAINGSVNETYNWSSCSKVLGGIDVINEDLDPFDDNGHGTHVAGIVAANGNLIGVAPDASIVSVKVFPSQGAGSSADVIIAIDWCTNHAKEYNISAISMSLSGGLSTTFCDASYPATAAAINSAIAKNISVVVATGNLGWTDKIGCPACIQNATRVGSTDDGSGGTTADQISNFTNRAPAFYDILLAPGRWIYSSTLGNTYETWHGTSMATPHVSGAIALLSQAHDLIYGRPAEPKTHLATLIETGKKIYDVPTTTNFSRIDIYAALNTYFSEEIEITSAYNSITGDNSSEIVINESDSALFNVSTNLQASFSWYLNSALQNNTLSNYVWQTSYADSGKWAVEVVASTSYTSDSFLWNITVFDVPLETISFNPAENITAPENTTTQFNITASRNTTQNTWILDNTIISNESQNTTITWNYSSAGIHSISYIGSDGFDTIVKNWSANITNVNRPPYLSPALNSTLIMCLQEQASYNISENIHDDDNDILSITVDDNNISVSEFVLYFNYSEVVISKPVVVFVSDSTSSVNQTIRITVLDSSGPKISIVSPKNIPYNTTEIMLNFSADKTAIWCAYSLNSAQNISCANTTLNAAEENNSITVFAQDALGNTNNKTIHFRVDTTNPSVFITYPASDKVWYRTAPNITASCIDSNFANMTINHTSYNATNTTTNVTWANSSSVPQNENSVKVACTDVFGRTGTTERSFYFDSVAPSLELTLPENKTPYNTTHLTLNYSHIEENIDACWYNYNETNTTLSECANTSFTALDNQQSTLVLYINDSAGNINSTTITFTVDTIAPELNVSFGNYTTNDFVFISATLSEAVHSCIITFDDEAHLMDANNTSCTYNATALAPGTYNFSIFANDNAGNWINTENFSLEVYYCSESYSAWSSCISGAKQRIHTLSDCTIVQETEPCEEIIYSSAGGYFPAPEKKINETNTTLVSNNTSDNTHDVLNKTQELVPSLVHNNVSTETTIKETVNETENIFDNKENTSPTSYAIFTNAINSLAQTLIEIVRTAFSWLF